MKGFTITELLIALGVMGMIAVFVLITYPSGRRQARDSKRKSDLKQYQTSLEAYADKNSGLYPGSVASGNLIDLCPVLGVSACPDDPIAGQHYQYEGSTLNYYLWTELENPGPGGSSRYFVVCANGRTDETGVVPTGADCPI